MRNVVSSLIEHLRFPFSIFLLPIFLFALAHSGVLIFGNWFVLFLVLHVLVYPSSNGYNSLMDADTESIGGIKNPKPVPKQMFVLSVMMDLAGIAITVVFYNWMAAVMLLTYILASRAYSYRGIRLKRFPILGYLTVFIFQGGWIFLLTMSAFSDSTTIDASWYLPALVSSLIIGASYPLTQIYQHKQDASDGVKTISMLLGVRGTFIFTLVLFLAMNILFFLYSWTLHGDLWPFMLFVLAMVPAGIYLTDWCRQAWANKNVATYERTMKMSVIGSVCMNGFFLFYLLALNMNLFSQP